MKLNYHASKLLFFFLPITLFAQTVVKIDSITFFDNHLRTIRGTSLHWVEDGDGLKLSKSSKEFSINDSLVSSLGYNVLRIPGGYLTRWFDWEKATGTQYGSQNNFKGIVETVRTGLAEMKLFAGKQKMKVMYTLNINDSPEKIRKLIQAWNSLPPNNGPTIDWFELGNENYDTNSTQFAAIQYIKTVLPIIRAIRTESPNAKLGALIANPVAPAWDTTIYSMLHEKIDFLVWHRYVPYTDYTISNSYQTTIASFSTVENELQYIYRLMTKRKLPIYLTEYNLSYYTSEKVHQNVVLETRFIFLLGNFTTLALRNHVDGMVKHSLANSGYHMFADINFSEKDSGKISISGMVSQLLNNWLMEQDSIAVIELKNQSIWERSILVGKNAKQVEIIVQNNTSKEYSVSVQSKLDITLIDFISYYQHGKEMWTDRNKSSQRISNLKIYPYSVSKFTLSR